MIKKMIDVISISISMVIFFFLVKHFYFDTKIGFDTNILELPHSSFPAFFDILVFVIIIPLLPYEIIQQSYDFISNKAM